MNIVASNRERIFGPSKAIKSKKSGETVVIGISRQLAAELIGECFCPISHVFNMVMELERNTTPDCQGLRVLIVEDTLTFLPIGSWNTPSGFIPSITMNRIDGDFEGAATTFVSVGDLLWAFRAHLDACKVGEIKMNDVTDERVMCFIKNEVHKMREMGLSMRDCLWKAIVHIDRYGTTFRAGVDLISSGTDGWGGMMVYLHGDVHVKTLDAMGLALSSVKEDVGARVSHPVLSNLWMDIDIESVLNTIDILEM